MKFFAALLFYFAVATAVNGQERKDLLVSFSGGFLNSPYYNSANAQGYYGFDFDYHLTERHILNAGFFAGRHSYYEDVRSNNPGSIRFANGNNAYAAYSTFSITYKYKMLDTPLLDAVAGIGAGTLTHTLDFPHREIHDGNIVEEYTETLSWSDLVFPVSLDLHYKISNHWQAGVSGGFLIHPDYPVLALHAGPKISYVLP